MYYEWLVRPFQELIEAEGWDQYTTSPFLWPADADGKGWTASRMTKCMQNASESGIGVKVGV